jgi:hypothetical protein
MVKMQKFDSPNRFLFYQLEICSKLWSVLVAGVGQSTDGMDAHKASCMGREGGRKTTMESLVFFPWFRFTNGRVRGGRE